MKRKVEPPPNHRNRPLVDWFSERMLDTLNRAGRRRWWKCEVLFLLDRLQHQVRALEGEIYNPENYASPDAIVKECADVANYAAFLAAQCAKQAKATRRGHGTNRNEKLEQMFKEIIEMKIDPPSTAMNEPCLCGSGKKFKECCFIVLEEKKERSNFNE